MSGSSDNTIRLWDVNSCGLPGVGTMTLTGHSDTVRCLHLNGSRLASGSNDFTIKVVIHIYAPFSYSVAFESVDFQAGCSHVHSLILAFFHEVWNNFTYQVKTS